MDIDFTPAETAFREEVRAFLRENLSDELRIGAAATPSVFVEPDIGQRWNALLHARGWLGYQWPVEHGGTGWSAAQRYIFEKECAEAGAPALTVLGLKLLAPVIWTFGNEAQQRFYLPRILSGEDYWCQGFSEPGSGSDLASLQCKAVRDGDRYILNGSKIWTTHGHHANRMFCLARTEATVRKQAGISFFLVNMDQPGISIRPILTHAGDHEVNQIFIEDVIVPIEDRVGEEGQGWTIAKFLLENERGGSCHSPKLVHDVNMLENLAASESDGAGGAMADQPEWKRRIATVRLAAQALEMIELRIVADIAKGRSPGPQTSLVKLLASNLRQKIDLLSMDLHGASGLQLETRRPLYGDNAPAPLHSREAQLAAPRYLNSRAWTIFGGTNEVQLGIIARSVLGL